MTARNLPPDFWDAERAHLQKAVATAGLPPETARAALLRVQRLTDLLLKALDGAPDPLVSSAAPEVAAPAFFRKGPEEETAYP